MRQCDVFAVETSGRAIKEESLPASKDVFGFQVSMSTVLL
jgi:hypothetical protein